MLRLKVLFIKNITAFVLHQYFQWPLFDSFKNLSHSSFSEVLINVGTKFFKSLEFQFFVLFYIWIRRCLNHQYNHY